jgi:uncharacterized protein DUF3306
MSEPDDGFLARWSRRKRLHEDPPTTEPPEAIPQISEQSAQKSESPEGADAERETEALPRIEDLTAESDLSAFLRAGVPQEIQKAALRRAWLLDPAIRDYCGPADYAFDFNDPDAVPGFASKEVVELAKKVLNELADAEQVAKDDALSSSPPSPETKENKD